MSIDRSRAPEDATHYFPGDQSWLAHWYKDGYFCAIGFEKEGWKKNHCPLPIGRYEELDARDKAVHDMLEIVNNRKLDGVSAQLGALYDAGYRK